MKARLNKRHRAFTIIELLVVIAVIVILVMMLLPKPRKPSTTNIRCISNQKQIALGLLMFHSDHRDLFPWQVSVTNGGAMESAALGDVVGCYDALSNSNYIQNPSVFRCATDALRSAAAPGAKLARTNVSYFMSIEPASTNSPSKQILTGDRHLASGGKPVAPGLFALTPNSGMTWTAELHQSSKPGAGAIAFADGHVEWVKQMSLSNVIARQNMPTNWLAVP